MITDQFGNFITEKIFDAQNLTEIYYNENYMNYPRVYSVRLYKYFNNIVFLSIKN